MSVPMAQGTTPAATATAEPDEDPPGTRAGSSGLRGVPWCALMPSPEKANSLRLVLPTQTRPAADSRATAGASCTAAGAPARTADAAVVGVPATSTMSFHATGTPSSGPAGAPARSRFAAERASSRARSAVSRVKAAPADAARASAASHSASASSSRAASSRPVSSAERTGDPATAYAAAATTGCSRRIA